MAQPFGSLRMPDALMESEDGPVIGDNDRNLGRRSGLSCRGWHSAGDRRRGREDGPRAAGT